ncbi:cyclin [Aspergillus egyptiacus]|nr:cyclin [Aspergillus egyptiacus]
MDFYLRCNSLSCRASLKERAVVTTCSHIFCFQCAESLGLSRPGGGERRCPACQSTLVNPDDAVATVLNPTEDYKTSVLSGLDPNTIMECAGRALLFWTYQTTQEIFYQEFLGKTLTDKYTNLNTQMDKVIHNSNTEISTLQGKLADMQAAQEQLRKKNQELVEMYREKCKKFSQITNLYNLLKSRAMQSQMQTAAASQAIHSLEVPRPDPARLASNNLGVTAPPQTPSIYQRTFTTDLDGVEQLHRHQRSGTGSSKGTKQKADSAAMPPPTRPGPVLGRGEPPNATPHHRTRLAGPSRPLTAMSQLPNDNVMLERFQTDRPPAEGFMGSHHSTHRESLNPQPHGSTDTSGIRSLFRSGAI